MTEFWKNLFASDFMPHGVCFLWNPEIVWLHAISDAVTTKPSGMGMGLSVSRSIVKSHGGRLWTSANDGPGVSFHVALAVLT